MAKTESNIFRPATTADARALMELERDTNLVALAHVFPDVSYPEGDVLRRWEQLLADPAVHVDVTGPPDRLEVYLAHDDVRLRHLGVRPELWGRGLARQAVARAISHGGVRRLWVLAENHRARGFYEHLGWRATGVAQQAEWPPYPVELEYRR
jgi:GNAT superfamily N-acetyltransferase